MTPVSIVDRLALASVEEADAAGLVWATDVGVERLFISMGSSKQPLEFNETEKPLLFTDQAPPAHETHTRMLGAFEQLVTEAVSAAVIARVLCLWRRQCYRRSASLEACGD
jgi:hypothetical protein